MSSTSAAFALPRQSVPVRRAAATSRLESSTSIPREAASAFAPDGLHISGESTDGWDEVSTDEYTPDKRSLLECAESFYDQADGIRNQLQPLNRTYDNLVALSSRLIVIHPNSIETPTLALDLRSALMHAASTLKVLDSNLFDLWESEERVRVACQGGRFGIDGLTGPALSKELDKRRDLVQSLARKFKRRCKEIKSEARFERDERREIREEKKEPVGVDDYLAGGTDCPDLTKNDLVHASRWVVTNPFTILSKLLDNLQALKIPEMVGTDQTPATFLASPPRSLTRSAQPTDPFSTPPLVPSTPTPAGSSGSRHPLADWKAEILRDAPAEKGTVHKVFDAVSHGLATDWLATRQDSSRAKKERMIVIFSFALLPLVLIAMLLETSLNPSDSSSSAKTASATSHPSYSLTTLFPTMVNEVKTAEGSARDNASTRPEDTLRRRDSFTHDSHLV
ncbi:hypothetical protein JCM10212_004643 [Sporobolomyces blumeae]